MFRFTLFITIFICSLGCTKKKDEITCTEEFRMHGVTIKGDQLTDFYTIRLSNLDTIRLGYTNGITDIWYPIIDDTYQGSLAGKTENFKFYGFINGAEVVKEDYVFTADACHIDKVSGKDEIQL